jgi:tRNA G10  N-methylase Trm11
MYKREDFLKKVVDDIMLPQNSKGWKVNLKDYDVEVVILVPSPSCLAVGLTLRPYQLLNTNAFNRNVLPSDVSLPYISGHHTSGITRLRPTNAQLLLELADIQLGDIVLDPCAGIGTIPLNATTKKGVGLGGDLLMAPNDSGGSEARVASLEYMRQFGRSHPSTNICAWDTGSLPIRSSSIDVIVSDLPFGKQCLSSSKLYMLLPLWLGEFARVLRPSGRIVLLCGAFGAVVECMQDINQTGKNENWIITATFPVNIGGILAWVVMAQRTSTPTIQVKNHQGRQRKLTANRDRNAKFRKLTVAEK